MKIQINHGFLSYERYGSGIPLLFIHGYPLSRKIWISQMKGLTDICDVISIDLRGHGESFPFDMPYPMDLLADDCKKVLEHENITDPITVCGLSMGGYITLALYRKYPYIFKGMILTSTRAGADTDQGKASRNVTIENVDKHGINYIVDNMLPKLLSDFTYTANPRIVHLLHEIMMETSQAGIIGASLGMRDRPDSTELLTEIDVPVLIMHGMDDKLIPITEAEFMNKHILNSHLIKIPNAGHLPNMEQPAQYNQALREFICSL